jgi:hypothetical protein
MSVGCPELLHPTPAKVAGLAGFRVWCYGWQRDFTAFYPSPGNPSFTPSAWLLTHAGGMFGLPKICSGTFFVADIHGTPVVISLVDPGGRGPGAYAHYFDRAASILRTIRFSP